MPDQIIASAPGRINLIGEHIDYHGGLVLPAATHFKTTFQLRKRADEQVIFTKSDTSESFAFELSQSDIEHQGWASYVYGVVKVFQKEGCTLGGFEASFSGDVPLGAGLSSSASLTCSLAMGLNALFECQLESIQLIQMAQEAEHEYVGIHCGIMDPFASIMGKKQQCILLDCDTLDYSYHPLQFGEYRILLLHSRVIHQLATSAYNERRMQSEAGLQILQKQDPDLRYLAHATMGMLEKLKDQMSETTYRRCRHVITEQDRVKEAVMHLAQFQLPAFGRLLYQSHQSLSQDYEVCCPETDFLVEQARHNPLILGARQIGGGFGGCVLHLIHQSGISDYIEQVNEAYQKAFGKTAIPMEIEIGEGASVDP